MKLNITAMNTHSPTTNPKPEFFPLPQKGRDPHFGLSRSYLYSLAGKGLIRLVRIRLPGQVRSKVLVPYAEVSAFLNGHLERTPRPAGTPAAGPAPAAAQQTEQVTTAP